MAKTAKTTKPVFVRVLEADHALLGRLAKRNRTTLSTYARRVLEQHFAEQRAANREARNRKKENTTA